MSVNNILKTVTTSRANDATVGDDPDFTVTGIMGSYYFVRVYAIIRCATTVPDFKWNFTSLGSRKWSAAWNTIDDAGGTSAEGRAVYNGADNVIQIPANTNVYLQIEAAIAFSSAGTFAFRWSQNTSNATPVEVLEGSFWQDELAGVT